MVTGIPILILGNTPEGTLFAGYFQDKGFSPLLLGRKRDSNAFTRLEAWGRSDSIEIRSLPQIEIFHAHAVIVTVQSFDVIGILERHIHYLPAHIPIICLSHGGIENSLTQFATNYPQFHWRIGTCEHDLQELIPGFFQSNSSTFRLLWGPLFQASERTQIEIDWGASNPSFFQWSPKILQEQRIRWLYELVIGTLTAALQLKTCGELLNRMDILAQVFEEGYRLGKERWQEWIYSEDKLFEGLISQISKRANSPSLMYLQTIKKQKTENQVFAGAASERYLHLWEFSKKIESMPQLYHMGG